MTKKTSWTPYDPAAVVDRGDAEAERLSEEALDRIWRLTMANLAHVPALGWVDKQNFRLKVGKLARALDWLSEKLGVCVEQVIDTRGGRREFELVLVNDVGEKAFVTLTDQELYHENHVRRMIFEATGLTMLDHHCWAWHDVVIIIRRAAEYVGNYEPRGYPTSGHLQTLDE